MLEVDQVRDCKRLHGRGLSIRGIAREVGVSRNTVRRYLREAARPGEYTMTERRAQPVRDALRPRVRELLEAEVKAEAPVPRKQRLTAARIHRIIVAEGLEASESVIRRLVREIRLDLRDPLEHAYLVLEYEPGRDAQVDFFEGVVEHPAEGRQKVHILLVRACYSGKTFAYAAPNQTREALLEGLMRAFEFFGGVFETLWFDNLTPAVRKVLRGRCRELQRDFARFQAFYGFKAEFCGPGKGNEKGGVEGGVKYSRHEILSPVPTVSDRQGLQRICDGWMERDGKRRIRGRELAIDACFEHEIPHLLPLPACRFEVGQIRVATVSPRSWVSIATNHYSVPVEWVGHEVTMRLDAERIVIRRGHGEVVEHRRSYGKCHAVVDIDHYLPLLKRKCRGLDRSLVFRRWLEDAGSVWASYLEALRSRLGEVAGSREFVDTLFLTRTRDRQAVTEAVEKTLLGDRVSLAVVRFFLSADDEREREAVTSLDYDGPKVAEGSAAAYMGLYQEVRYA